jgi:hypothetical protein
MGLRCKVGDMYVLSTPWVTCVVSVVGVADPRDRDADWLVDLVGRSTPTTPDDLWAAKDSWLTPLRGLPADETTDTLAPATV